jgi:hypothetical protein
VGTVRCMLFDTSGMTNSRQPRVSQTIQIALTLRSGLDNGRRDGFARGGRLGGATDQSAGSVKTP